MALRKLAVDDQMVRTACSPGVTVCSVALLLCAACAGPKDLQATPDAPPNAEILRRIEVQFAKAEKAYPRLSEMPAPEPQSLSSTEAEAIGLTLDELGAMLNELLAMDALLVASEKELKVPYKGEELSLEAAAKKMTADMEALRKRVVEAQREPVPVLGGRAPKRAEGGAATIKPAEEPAEERRENPEP